MNSVIEASQLPEGEKVYLKKDFMGWRVIEPWKDPETGKINWFNLLTGGKKNLYILIGITIILIFIVLAVREQITNFNTVMSNPCAFCVDCQEQARNLLSTTIKYVPPTLNVSDKIG